MSITRRGAVFAAAAATLGLDPGRQGRAAQAGRIRCSGTAPSNLANYAPQLVAITNGYFSDEGLDFRYIVAGGGAKTREIVASGQADFGLGDVTHPLQMINRGRPAKMLMAVDDRFAAVNVVVRSDLFGAGVDTLEKFGRYRGPGGKKPVLAVTTLGGGQENYANFIFSKLGLVDDCIWVAGGDTKTILGGLMTKRYDAIVAALAQQYEAEDKGFGRTVYDISDKAAWDGVFGGSSPATVFYALQSTVDAEPAKVQAYVNANYRGLQWIRQASVDEVYAATAERYLPEIDPSLAKREIAYFKKAFAWSGGIDSKEYVLGSRIWFRSTTEIKPVPYEEAVDLRFLEAARRKFGS